MNASNDNKQFIFNMTADTTGYVAIGFATDRREHVGADMYVGFVDDETGQATLVSWIFLLLGFAQVSDILVLD